MDRAVLVLLRNDRVARRTFELDVEATIGGPDDDIDVADGPVAIVRRYDGRWCIRPTSTRCRIDGDPLVGELELQRGQVLECGDARLLFLTGDLEHALDDERHVQTAIDPLTGVLHRKFLYPYAMRAPRPAALLYIDIDRMKQINDRFGHLGGDLTLRRTAANLLRAVRWPNVAMRIAGEEFVVVMPSTTRDQALARAEQIRRTAEPPFDFEGEPITATLSIGVAMIGDDVWDQVREAEDNVTRAKTEGRNRVIG